VGHSRFLPQVALLVGSLIATLLAVELFLRVGGYTYSPLALLPPERGADHRPHHALAIDPRVSPTEPLTSFDPVLLWRLNPRATFQVNAEGFRGPLPPRERDADDVLIVALGDSNTLGPLHEPDHWPGYLQRLVALNGGDSVRILNAGVYGYSSLQGLRRFGQVLRLRPKVAYWCFGANDAHRVAVPDSVWARRAAWLGRLEHSRLALFLAARLWGRTADADGRYSPVPRVSLEDYRRHLESFVRLCRDAGVRPVLLTRPFHGRSSHPDHWLTHAPAYNAATCEAARRLDVDLLDAFELFRDDAAAFSDDSHLNRRGLQRLARALVRQLAALGILESQQVYADRVDLATVPDHASELGPGWWRRERWQDRYGGRWTASDALLTLQANRAARFLTLEATVAHPRGSACFRVEASGRDAARLCRPNGSFEEHLPLPLEGGSVATVRLLAEEPFVPPAPGEGPADRRELGLFVHRVSLSSCALADRLELAVAGGRPELGDGWWEPEVWPDGRRGRWTREAASLRLGRAPSARFVVLDVSGENPGGRTRVNVTVNGDPARRFELANGRHPLLLPLPPEASGCLEIAIRIDNPFLPVPASPPSASDERRLGIFVHRVLQTPLAL
jgi:lysophospholipase L1-like esterase